MKRETSPEPVQEEAIKAKVSVIHEHPNRTPPAIGYFPSGFDQEKFSGSTNFQLYRNKNMPKRLELAVRPASAPVEFVGTNYSGEAAAGHRGRYALGVYDKETEKIRKRKALRHDYDPYSLSYKMKNLVVSEKAMESKEAHVSRNIPPYDAFATTPQDAFATTPQEVYDLDKIILEGEWDHLEDIYNILQQGEEADFKDYPLFIRNRTEKLKNTKDESEKKKLSCIFSYLNHLIKFKDQHAYGISSSKRHTIPKILRHKFTSMFGVSDSKMLPREKYYFLISYVLVLTLHTDEFETEYKDIVKDLQMCRSRVTKLYKQLGCQISKRRLDNDNVLKTFATLSVPLKFPTTKMKI